MVLPLGKLKPSVDLSLKLVYMHRWTQEKVGIVALAVWLLIVYRIWMTFGCRLYTVQNCQNSSHRLHSLLLCKVGLIDGLADILADTWIHGFRPNISIYLPKYQLWDKYRPKWKYRHWYYHSLGDPPPLETPLRSVWSKLLHSQLYIYKELRSKRIFF